MPRDTQYSWVAFEVPIDHSSSVTDLVDEYASVAPVNSRFAQCTTTTLLDDGHLITSEPSSYVIWDPTTGGTGGGPPE